MPKPIIIPDHPDLLPDPEADQYREEPVESATPSCVCPCYNGIGRPGPCRPCLNDPTQEDGLCDRCRPFVENEYASARDNHCHIFANIRALETFDLRLPADFWRE
jgi:hypothetical protein